MFEIVFLGTSAAAPSIHRGLSSAAILAGEQRYLLDCGEGTQRQILRSGIGFKKLNRILLTHAHLDHILGLGGLVSTFAHWENIDWLEIYGGKATLDRVHALLYGVVLAVERITIDISLVAVQSGVIVEGRDHSVSAFPVVHRGPGNIAYIFQERPHRPFLVDRAAALGVPAGPERGRLVAGEAIALPEGRVIAPDDVLGEAIPGTKLVMIGDIGRLDAAVRAHVEGADVLVIESTFLDDQADVANSFGHITARQAATFARDAGVKTLILNHISRRYRQSDVLHQAQSVFPETYVARDLDHFVLKRGKPVEKIDPQVVRERARAAADAAQVVLDSADDDPDD